MYKTQNMAYKKQFSKDNWNFNSHPFSNFRSQKGTQKEFNWVSYPRDNHTAHELEQNTHHEQEKTKKDYPMAS